MREIIKKELGVFEKIRSQSFNKHFEVFYFPLPDDCKLKHGEALPLPLPRNIKNLRFQIEYKFLSISNSHDWLGIHLRQPAPDMMQTELVYVRSNESLESVSFPGRRTPEVGKPSANINLQLGDGFRKLELIIVENSLRAITPERYLEDDKLLGEGLGGIVLHAWAHNPPTQGDLVIHYRKIEIISLDTTSPI